MKYAASWLWSPRDRPRSDEAADLNPWGADQLARLLRTLRPLARVRQALLNGPPDAAPIPAPQHDWDEQRDVTHEQFERSLYEAVRAAPCPVTSVDLMLDLWVWVRTAPEAEPQQGWLRSGARVSLQLERDDPYGSLGLEHTLFRDGATHGESNRVLHRLNQPLLQAMLAAIEADHGPVVEVEGLPDVTRQGFQDADEG